jgi:hypothetical protein
MVHEYLNLLLTSKTFGPIVAAACVLDGETTLN